MLRIFVCEYYNDDDDSLFQLDSCKYMIVIAM